MTIQNVQNVQNIQNIQNVQAKVEHVLSTVYQMTENGINNSGIYVQLFEDEQTVDICYSQNDEPIDLVSFNRDDMTDVQAADLTCRIIMMLVDNGIKGEQLKAIAEMMKQDVINPLELQEVHDEF